MPSYILVLADKKVHTWSNFETSWQILVFFQFTVEAYWIWTTQISRYFVKICIVNYIYFLFLDLNCSDSYLVWFLDVVQKRIKMWKIACYFCPMGPLGLKYLYLEFQLSNAHKILAIHPPPTSVKLTKNSPWGLGLKPIITSV